MKLTAGTLLYRQTIEGLEVLLVHPAVAYSRKAAWSIPKGEIDKGESHEEAARRETWEETGIKPTVLVSLGSVTYTKSRKKVYCFTGPAPSEAVPRCASREIDRAAYVLMDEAKKIIHSEQLPLLARLEKTLSHGGKNKM